MLSIGRKSIGCKLVFKLKYYFDRSVKRFKGKIVALEFSQVHNIDYIEIFSSTIRRKSLRIFLAIATIIKMIILQIDIIGVYLESALSQNNQPIYMKIC